MHSNGSLMYADEDGTVQPAGVSRTSRLPNLMSLAPAGFSRFRERQLLLHLSTSYLLPALSQAYTDLPQFRPSGIFGIL